MLSKSYLIFLKYFEKHLAILADIGNTFINKILTLLMGLLASVLIAKALGPAGRGEYAVAAFITALGVQLTNLGIPSANAFFIAQDKKNLPSFYENSLYLGLFLGVLAIPIFMGYRYFYPETFLLNDNIWYVALASIPFALSYMLFQHILLGKNKITAYNKIELQTKIILLVGVIILTSFEIFYSALFYSLTFLSVALGFYLTNKIIKQDLIVRPEFNGGDLLKSLRFGFKPYTSCILSFLQQKISILLIMDIGGAKEVGLYSIAVLFFDVMYMLPVTVGIILFPLLSSLNNTREKWLVAKKFAILTGVVMLILAAILLIFSNKILMLVFGYEYIGSEPYLIFILPGLIFISISGVLMNYFAASGTPMIMIMSPLISLGILILSSYILEQHFGSYAPAIGMSISYGTSLILSLIYLFLKKESRGS